MARRSVAGLVARISAAVLALANGSSTFASGEPQESLLYQNFLQARELLDHAVAAHGGRELLDRALDIRLSLTGTLRREGHYARPWAHRDSPLEGTWLFSADLGAVKSELTEKTDPPQVGFTIVGPANGIDLAVGGSEPDSIPEEELEDRLREEFEFLPHEFLRQARARAASLRLLSADDDFDIIHYTLENGENRALFLDSETHLLSRVERIDHWELKGDRLEWRTFAEYADRNGIFVPLRSEIHKENGSSQYNITTEITTIEFGAKVKAEEFSIPPASRAGFDEWTLRSATADKGNELLPVHDLGKGAYIIDLPTTDSRSLLVGFSDFAVVVEAGDHSELSAQLLLTAARVLPDKPVRYVAMSHHHPLYANGMRPYVQRGITVLATAGNVDYYRDLATRPYRIHPDEQERNPKEPIFEVTKGTRILKDMEQRLEFHEFDYSTHTDEFVLTYLPSHKLIVTGDLVYILRDDEPSPANSRERALHRVVTEQGLDVESIVQTWFLERSDQLTPYAHLEEKIRLAEAKDAAH